MKKQQKYLIHITMTSNLYHPFPFYYYVLLFKTTVKIKTYACWNTTAIITIIINGFHYGLYFHDWEEEIRENYLKVGIKR